jgi:hypothetical protein
MKINSATLFLLIAAIASVASAGAHHAPTKPLEELSYRAVGKLIYLPVRVNGGAAHWFCLDSGAPESMLDQATAEQAGVKARGTGILRGAGKGTVAAAYAPPVRLKIGKLTTIVDRSRIVDLSGIPVPVRMAGLVGAEFFEKYVVRIDTDRHRIAFFDPDSYNSAPPSSGASVPLELTDHRLYVEIYLEPRAGEGAMRRVRVDTGSEDSVDDDTVKRSATVTSTRLGNGLGESYIGYSGVYSSVRIGPYEFQRVWGPAGTIPIVGMEMLRRFTMTFNARKGRLDLDPNRHLNEAVPAPR